MDKGAALYLLCGGGGHAVVVLEALKATHPHADVWLFEAACYWDALHPSLHHLPRVDASDVQAVSDLLAQANRPLRGLLGLGQNERRKEAAQQLAALGIPLATVIHPMAWVSPSAQVGAGCVLLPFAVLHSDARLGEGCILNTHAVSEHHTHVGCYSHLAPGAKLLGAAELGDVCLLGANAVVHPCVQVGSGVRIGAGSVLTRSWTPIEAPAGSILLGQPARLVPCSEPSA